MQCLIQCLVITLSFFFEISVFVIMNNLISKTNSRSFTLWLTLSWRRSLSYRNQSIDLLCKSMDWFLYDNGPRHERVNELNKRFLRFSFNGENKSIDESMIPVCRTRGSWQRINKKVDWSGGCNIWFSSTKWGSGKNFGKKGMWLLWTAHIKLPKKQCNFDCRWLEQKQGGLHSFFWILWT